MYHKALTLPITSQMWPGCDLILWCETILYVVDNRYKAWLTWESTSASVNLNNSELCLNLSKNQMESCFHFTSLKMQPASSPVSQTKDKKCHHHWSNHGRSLPSKLYWNGKSWVILRLFSTRPELRSLQLYIYRNEVCKTTRPSSLICLWFLLACIQILYCEDY